MFIPILFLSSKVLLPDDYGASTALYRNAPDCVLELHILLICQLLVP